MFISGIRALKNCSIWVKLSLFLILSAAVVFISILYLPLDFYTGEANYDSSTQEKFDFIHKTMISFSAAYIFVLLACILGICKIIALLIGSLLSKIKLSIFMIIVKVFTIAFLVVLNIGLFISVISSVQGIRLILRNDGNMSDTILENH